MDNVDSSEDMPGGKNTPLWIAFPLSDYTAIRDWILTLPPAVGPSPTPGGGDVLSAVGPILRGTSDTARLGDRVFVNGVLKDIYGSGVSMIAFEKVLKRAAFFGGNCDPKEAYVVGATTNRMSCEGVDDVGDVRMVPLSSALRGGFLGNACYSIHANDALVRVAAGRAGAGATLAWPTAVNISNAYQLFYPGHSLPAQLETVLAQVSDGAKLKFPAAPIEGWRYLLLTLCSTPDWQVP